MEGSLLKIPGVMLCKDDLAAFIKAAGSVENTIWSVKLDGVRCLAGVSEDGGVKFYSRNKKEFPNFGKFMPALRGLATILNNVCDWSYPIWFDGEVTSKDKRFDKVMTQVRRLKDVDASIFQYNIFDGFNNVVLASGAGFGSRYSAMLKAFNKDGGYDELLKTSCDVILHEHNLLGSLDEKEIMCLADKICDFGEEGIVLKVATSPYIQKRSHFWCKVKRTETADLAVIRPIEGTGKYKGMLGALECDYEGHTVCVGTGYVDSERVEFWKDPPSVIEVKFQEKTRDGSLRFPVFMRVREDKDVE